MNVWFLGLTSTVKESKRSSAIDLNESKENDEILYKYIDKLADI